MIWWILGMPVLWIRQLMCWAGLHDDGDYGVTGFGDHCMRCLERVDR